MRIVTWPAALLLVALHGLAAAPLRAAQSVSAAEREALVRLHAGRGGRAGDVDALIRIADEAAAKGLPLGPLANKIREGLAKGAAPQRIEAVVRQMAAHLEAADRLMREMEPVIGSGATAPATPAGTGRETAVALLADAIGGGVTADEVREIGRQAKTTSLLSADALAGSAKALSFIKDAALPVPEGTAVVVEAVRRGFQPHEVLDLGREVKRREDDYRAGRASLVALRDAIARGDRPDQLFRDGRAGAADRPAAARPETVVDRPERPSRPETPQRPEPPSRPSRPERPERPGGRVQ